MIFKVDIPISVGVYDSFFFEGDRCPYYNEIVEILGEPYRSTLEHVTRWPFIGPKSVVNYDWLEHPKLGLLKVRITRIMIYTLEVINATFTS